jgi:epoxyqueuosine reductase QueG
VVTRKVDQIVLDGGLYLEGLDYKTISVAASQPEPHLEDEYVSFFPHKTAARLSRLGFIGKSALLITKAFGTLPTNLPIEGDSPITENMCGACSLCADNRTTKAIQGKK